MPLLHTTRTWTLTTGTAGSRARLGAWGAAALCLLAATGTAAQPKSAGKAPAPPAAAAAKPAATSSARPAASSAPASGLPPIDEPTKLFDLAGAAHALGRYAEAEELLRAVWEKKKTYDVAAALGAAERKLGKHRDAAEHLAFALRTLPPSEVGATQQAIEEDLAAVQREIGTLHIEVNVAGADVLVDGRLAGKAPLGEPVFVSPGPVTLVARRDGHESATRTLDVKKGATVHVTLALGQRSLCPVYALGGAGAAGIVAGAVLAGVSEAKIGEARTLRDGISAAGGYCGGPGLHPDCAKLRAAGSLSDAAGTASIVAFAVGGAAAAAAVAYLLWPGPTSPAKTEARVAPAVSRDAAALFVSGSF